MKFKMSEKVGKVFENYTNEKPINMLNHYFFGTYQHLKIYIMIENIDFC